jgi:FKBP-type peptidyl-prolyl cis-trans isomerase
MSKRFIIIVGLGLLACGVRAQNQNAGSQLKDDKQKLSYSMGMSLGMYVKRTEADVDLDTVAKGMKDAINGGPTLLSEQEMREVMMKFTQELRAKQMAKINELKEKNKKDGEAFLAQNANKPGVITLPSGLQYQILNDGNGDNPKPEDTVAVKYAGSFIDGTQFDSSDKHPQPFTARVGGGVIKGWTEALQLMKPGSKWRIFVPPDLAYGPNGFGQAIPPNATLVFDIELLTIMPGAPPASQEPPPLTSDIIKVPSAEELKRGAKIETIKPEDIAKEQAKATNASH